jgi:hypothetical protein
MRRVYVGENGKGMAMERDSGGGRLPPPLWPGLCFFLHTPDLAMLFKFTSTKDCPLPSYVEAQGYLMRVNPVGLTRQSDNSNIPLTYSLPCDSK